MSAEEGEHDDPINLDDIPEEYKWLREQLMNAELRAEEEGNDWEDPTGGTLANLLEACEQGEASAVEQLLDKLKEQDAGIDTPGPDGDTALHIACLYGQQACVELLLAKGANANIVNEQDGSTALHDAAAGGYLDICKLVLEKGSASLLTAADEDGDTVLHHAARGGYLDVCQFLVEKGADPKTKNKDDNTPREEADEEPVVTYLKELENK